jgi:hypothetical protein
MNIFKAIRASRILDERDRTHAGIPAELNDQAVIDAELSDPSSTPWQQPPNFVHSRVMNAIAASRHARMRPRALPTWPLGWAAAAAVVLMVAGTPMGRTLWSSLQEAGSFFSAGNRMALTPPPIVEADVPTVAALPRSDADDPARREIEALREDTRRAARAIFSDPDDNDGW